MSTLVEMTVPGRAKSVFPTKFQTDSFKGFSPVDGSITSTIQGGTISFEIDLEEETDSESFFAAWFLDNSKKDANFDITPTGSNQKILTIQALDAQLVSYSAIIDQHVDPKIENSTVLILLVCLSIVIGSSPLTRGFGN